MSQQNTENPNRAPESDINSHPNFKSSVQLKYVKLGYHYLISNAIYLMFGPVLVTLLNSALVSVNSLHDLAQISLDLIKYNFTTFIVYTALLIFLGIIYSMTRPRKVYLVDFACHKPNPSLKITKEYFVKLTGLLGCFTKENVEFQKKITERAGLGQETYLPEALTVRESNLKVHLSDAKTEAEMIMMGAVDELFAKTKVDPKDIGIVIVNCSLYNAIPSLSAMIVNRYKLRDNILSYNLSGMGCSAGLISIDLARQLLQVHVNSYALVVSTENITQDYYRGNDRSMLVSNCLFRLGAAAILLSNRHTDRQHSKYELVHLVRTHKGADDKSYACVHHKQDENMNIGVALSKDLIAIAGEALKANITTVGPLILPMSEQLLFFIMLVARKAFKMKIKPYVPDFKLAVEHFCIHAGGRAVLDELEKNLELTSWHMEPSRMTLYRYGNISSSSLWYELAYTEAKGRIKKGHRTWQIAFGSGFKCNSAIWRSLKTIDPAKEKNPWMDEIDKYPVHVPKFTPVISS